MAEVKTEIQRGFYKQRLTMKNEEERELLGESEEEAEKRETNSHALVDEETNIINFNNLRPTDLPTNKQVGVPPLASNKVEIQMAAIEAELVQTTKDYIEKKCDRHGFPNESNLNVEQSKGIKELIEMTKKENVIVTESDKSSKLCLDSLPEYVAMAEPHISKDKVVTAKEVATFEKVMNGHSYQLCRIFGVCTAWDNGRRVKGAMTNKTLPPPCLKLCHKDHKETKPGLPAPRRPICSASLSPNGQASHLISLILNELARHQDQGTECRSTEKMIAGMEDKVNKADIQQLVVGGMDVSALYPNLLAIPSTQIITEVFMETDITIEGINWEEVGKYLAINLTREEIRNLGLQEVVSSRAKVGGCHPGMTTAEVMGKLYWEEEEEVPSLFHPPKRWPTEREQKILLAQVIRVASLAILQHHTYQFNEEVRLQSDGGPIGLELAVAMARVVMLWWDQKFLHLSIMNCISIYLYLRYIDDQNTALEPLPLGTRWMVGPCMGGLGGKMVVVDHLVEEDRLLARDQHTMVEVRKMADSISPMIQLEEDYCTKHSDNLLPILDLQVQVKEVGGFS